MSSYFMTERATKPLPDSQRASLCLLDVWPYTHMLRLAMQKISVVAPAALVASVAVLQVAPFQTKAEHFLTSPYLSCVFNCTTF